MDCARSCWLGSRTSSETLADENIDPQLVRGLLRRQPDLDIVLARDAKLLGRSDSDLLQWAADESRVVVTYDVRTLPNIAYGRVVAGLHMPGVIAIRSTAGPGTIIEDLLIVIGASAPDELEGRVLHSPL